MYSTQALLSQKHHTWAHIQVKRDATATFNLMYKTACADKSCVSWTWSEAG